MTGEEQTGPGREFAPADPPISGYSAALFLHETLDPPGGLAHEGVWPKAATESAVALVARLRAAGFRTALIVSGDHHGPDAHAEHNSALFDVVTRHRAGDDASATMLLEAAEELKVSPDEVVVITASAQTAGDARSAGFGLVVGVRGLVSRQQLEDAGAMVVVGDLAELDLGVSRSDPWVLRYDGFDPMHEGHREVLTALGNGYLGFRSTHPERRDDGVHYPGTYIAGVFNRTRVDVEGYQAHEEHLVNLPSWLPFDVRFGNSPWWSEQQARHADEQRRLDLRRGVLSRLVSLRDSSGDLDIVQRTFASMEDPHLVVMETTLTPRGWSGRLRVRAGVDAAIRNANTGAPFTTHLTPPDFDVLDDGLLCEVDTTQSGVRIAVAVRTEVDGAVDVLAHQRHVGTSSASEEFDLLVTDGTSIRVVKLAALVTSKDPAIASARDGAMAVLRRNTENFDTLLERHQAAWQRLWQLFEIRLHGQPDAQLMLNLHLFHLLQAISSHTGRVDAGVPARGLNGEGYRGHIFWDEMFVLPVLGQRLPEITRGLLDYRWHRLDAAREAARAAGWVGAQFPWQSGSDGREETPQQLYNQYSRRWMPDNSSRQRHVGLAVAFEAWQYFQETGDLPWLATRGADLMVEVGRYFASRASWDPEDERFHIDGVMGPDEYHDGYPEAPGEGLRDNAYTNILTAWLFARLADARELLDGHYWDDVADRLQITTSDLQRWDQLRRGLSVPFHEDRVISQFAGYDRLAEFDWADYRHRYGNIGRLDLILESEGDATNRYKLSKQADVLMLLYLLGADGLLEQLSEMEYQITRDDLRRTLQYYSHRTSHGSTLSRVVHASVWAGFDPAHSWDLFREALVADLDDTQGGTTRHGVHLGAMAGTADIVVRSFAGLTLNGGDISFSPSLPDHLTGVSFTIQHRGHCLAVTVTHTQLVVRAAPSTADPVGVRIGAIRHELAGNSTITAPSPTLSERKAQ